MYISTRYLNQDRVAVKVERLDNRKRKYKVITGSICLLPAGTKLIEIPSIQIVDDTDTILQPEGKYYLTAETIDPYHLCVDIF